MNSSEQGYWTGQVAKSGVRLVNCPCFMLNLGCYLFTLNRPIYQQQNHADGSQTATSHKYEKAPI
jgi:hypothetical protein